MPVLLLAPPAPAGATAPVAPAGVEATNCAKVIPDGPSDTAGTTGRTSLGASAGLPAVIFLIAVLAAAIAPSLAALSGFGTVDPAVPPGWVL